MSSDAYREILRQVEQLSPAEQLNLIQDIITIVRPHIVKPRYSVIGFRGIAKDLWKDVDVEEYIRKERESWDRE